MKDLLLLIGIFVAWFVLNAWLLPKMGVPTGLSGSCAVDPRVDEQADEPVLVTHDSGKEGQKD